MLVVIDMQDKLLDAIDGWQKVINKSDREPQAGAVVSSAETGSLRMAANGGRTWIQGSVTTG